MDQRTLLGIVAAVRRSLDEFVQNSHDPTQSLDQLSGEIDRLFLSVLPRLSPEDQEIAMELQAILLDQIALVCRSQATSHGSVSLPYRT